MKKSIIEKFLAPYADSSLQLQKKSRMLAWTSLSFVAAPIPLSLLLIATGAFIAGLSTLALALLALLSLILLARGRYTVASTIMIFGLWAACFAAIKFDAYKNVYETYVFAAIGGFLLVVGSLLADKSYQIWILGALNILGILLLYFLDSFPQDNKTFTTLAIQNLAVSNLLILVGTYMASALVRMQNTLLAEIEQQVERTRKSYAELNRAVAECQAHAVDIGDELSNSAGHTITTIQSVHEKVRGIISGMDELAAAIYRSAQENDAAVSNQEKVRTILDDFTAQVATASSSIEQMVASVRAISAQATQKGTAVEKLLELVQSGESRLSDIQGSIDGILKASEQMVEMTSFIENVADRTNLLGMNASIEAAHAGNAGKGFSVVADQIRSLSIETGDSSRVIAKTLLDTQNAIAETSRQNQEVIEFFRQISEEIRGVTHMIQELLANITEISSGANGVLEAVETVAQLTGTTEIAVNDSRQSIGRSSEGLTKVSDIAGKVKTESNEMAHQFDDVRRQSEKVLSLGTQNQKVVSNLRQVVSSS